MQVTHLCYWLPISHLSAPLQLLHGCGVHGATDEGRNHSHTDGKAHKFMKTWGANPEGVAVMGPSKLSWLQECSKHDLVGSSR
jgi:hypothetical protein